MFIESSNWLFNPFDKILILLTFFIYPMKCNFKTHIWGDFHSQCFYPKEAYVVKLSISLICSQYYTNNQIHKKPASEKLYDFMLSLLQSKRSLGSHKPYHILGMYYGRSQPWASLPKGNKFHGRNLHKIIKQTKICNRRVLLFKLIFNVIKP